MDTSPKALITMWDVRALLTTACPDLEAAFAEEDAMLDPGEQRLTYVEIGATVRQLGKWFREGRTSCFEALFATAERCLLEGDEEAVTLILVGLFEDLQNGSMTELPDFGVWEPFLGPVSARGWRAVADFWNGDLDAIRRFEVR